MMGFPLASSNEVERLIYFATNIRGSEEFGGQHPVFRSREEHQHFAYQELFILITGLLDIYIPLGVIFFTRWMFRNLLFCLEDFIKWVFV